MNKIQVKKSTQIPRHHIIHRYKANKPPIRPNIGADIRRPAVVKKAARNNILVKSINKVQPLRRPLIKSTKPRAVKAVSVKSALMPKRTRNVKSTFDSRTPQIRLIKGVGEGKVLVMMAPGPSILEAEIEKLNGISKIDTMTINKPDKRIWPSDYWMFCDRTQYTRNKEEFHKFSKTIINTDSIKATHPRQIKIKNLPGKGFSYDMVKGFYIGRSTTFSAMQVAAYMGYDKIFIFGLDMCRVGKKLHSYGINPDVPEKIREKRFKKESEFYNVAAKIMKEDLRNKYYICSSYNPWSFVDLFNRMDQKKAVGFILECANEYKNFDKKS